MTPSFSPFVSNSWLKVSAFLKKGLPWSLYTFFFLGLFTFLRFPNERLYPYFDRPILEFLESKGASFTAEKRSFSWLFGKYQLSQVTLFFPPPFKPQKMEEVTLSISWLPLLLKKLSTQAIFKTIEGGTFELTSRLNFELSGSAEFKINKFPLEVLGLGHFLNFPFLCLIQEGKGNLRGDFSKVSSLEGEVQLSFGNTAFLPQKISGFHLPFLDVLNGKIEAVLSKKELKIRHFSLGKKENFPNPDDFILEVNGNVSLHEPLVESRLDLKIEAFLSDKIMKAIPILELVLNNNKKENGSYFLGIEGTINDPQFSSSTLD